MMANIYHVAKQGADFNNGSQALPFATIQKAADLAAAGDLVVVHQGEYREWVKPRAGGLHEGCRITYEAAEGERVIIKGSERITGWTVEEGTTWSVCLSNTVFDGENPYAVPLYGDWFVEPTEYAVHAGDVYLNGKSFYEARSLDEVKHPKKRMASAHETWANREELIQEPEMTIYKWYCQVDEEKTIIYANFHGLDPNHELVEINVRRCCFFPEATGLDYITVRGFEMAQAATPWAPPTADQPGLIGPNWSRGWIIENNIIHDSKCSGISLGKERSTGNNDFTKWHRKPGYQYQMEAVFRARGIGWSKERIGSHIVRNNMIYDCGQNGIVGHLGCIFSEISGNEIYNIAVKHEYYGHEIAAIKLHAAIDVQIHNNYIHDCTLGTWLDWQAQGTRISCNVYDRNNRDFMIEVTQGPYLVDNNIFTSPYTFDNAAQGGAYVHNLCCGFMNHYPILNRSTPYHFQHSTDIMGTALVYGFDDRWYQNIFVGGTEEGRWYGTGVYDGAPVNMAEYIHRVRSLGNGDVEQYEMVKQPVYVRGNAYLYGARAFEREENYCMDGENPQVRILAQEEGVYLEIMLPQSLFEIETEIINTDSLGTARIPEARFENPDGTRILINKDLLGKKRPGNPAAGPLQGVKAGRNRIMVYKPPIQFQQFLKTAKQ